MAQEGKKVGFFKSLRIKSKSILKYDDDTDKPTKTRQSSKRYIKIQISLFKKSSFAQDNKEEKTSLQRFRAMTIASPKNKSNGGSNTSSILDPETFTNPYPTPNKYELMLYLRT